MQIFSSQETQEIRAAAELLKSGEIVAFPTETVYGLGAAIFDPIAIAKIYRAKNRPADNPLIAHISDLQQVSGIAQSLPEEFFLLAEYFWPGPLTLLVTKRPEVPAIASAGLPTIGIRMPAHAAALLLIEAVGQPLVAPSANLSGKPSATRLSHVLHDFEGRIAAVLDGGDCSLGLESTVLDITDPLQPVILRPGSIRAEELSAVLGRDVQLCAGAPATDAAPRSPGLKYRHYAPEATVHLFWTVEELELRRSQYAERCLVLAPPGTQIPCPYVPLHAHTLYAELREADRQGFCAILVLCEGPLAESDALMNRLRKAASSCK